MNYLRRIILYIMMFFYFLINYNVVTAVADSTYDSEDFLELYGESALLMDAKTGEVLYEKNGDKVRAIASTTKILTCLIALEEASQDDIVTVSANAASQPDVQMNIAEGEQYRLGDLLKGMMLESYNDVSVAVAEHVAGSAEAFSKKMNERAQKIGCKDSYFITPNGLDAKVNNKENASTAYDIALIMAEALKNDEFLAITQTKEITIHERNNQRVVNAYNRNSFLSSYEGALSGKTGFTGKAGYCYVGAVQKEDRTFIAVTLGCGWPPHKTYKWKDMNTLFDYGFENYFYRNLRLEEQKTTRSIYVEHAKGKHYKEKVYIEVKIPMENTVRLLKKTDHYYGKLILPKSLEAPLEENECIGRLEIYINNKMVERREIQVPYVVEKHNFWSNIYQILCYVFDKICRKSIEIT